MFMFAAFARRLSRTRRILAISKPCVERATALRRPSEESDLLQAAGGLRAGRGRRRSDSSLGRLKAVARSSEESDLLQAAGGLRAGRGRDGRQQLEEDPI